MPTAIKAPTAPSRRRVTFGDAERSGGHTVRHVRGRPVWLLLAPGALFVAACVLFPITGSKGTMPPPGPNGEIDPSAVPDFVAVAGSKGVAGYVAKEAMLGGASEQSWPVYADDLRTIVGHLVPGRGFVPVGVDAATVPTFEAHAGPLDPNSTPMAGTVFAYVRNRSHLDAYVAVVADGHVQNGATGFLPDGNIGVSCGPVPPGSRLVLLDRSPIDPAARPKQTIYVGVPLTGSVSLSIDVSPDDVATVGNGIPDWWTSGPPPAC
jgi:hypothetical protein